MIAKLLVLGGKVRRRLLMYVYRPLFAAHGRNFRFDPHGAYTFNTIRVGADVNLGFRPILSATASEIIIGNKVMFGNEVVVLGGNHNTAVVGRFMFDVTEKRPEDDRHVIIEDDVWIGSRAMILSGVVVGRGSIVGAGAVVTKRVPPYSIVAGVPARIVRFRWDVDTILRHEAELYPAESRLSRDTLEATQCAASRT